MTDKRIAFLRQELEYHSQLYYNYDSSEISDYDWDKMLSELKRLEDYQDFDDHLISPTQHVGALRPEVYDLLYPNRPVPEKFAAKRKWLT